MPPAHPPIRSSAHRKSPLEGLPIEFIGSFPDPGHRLVPPLPEVAFLGRSNVGKSSLLNALVGRQGLARVSGTPGKTQALNAFRLPTFYLVDLPGYGYAKASKATRAGLDRLVQGYMRREYAAGVVWLLDSRRDPSEEDLRTMDELARQSLPVLAVLTKADKLGRGAQATRRKEISRALGLEDDQVLLTSSTTGLGITELGESVLALVRQADTGVRT